MEFSRQEYWSRLHSLLQGILPIKKNETLPSAAVWVIEIIILSEVSQRKTNIIFYLFVESKKNVSNELIYKTETDSQNKFVVTRQEESGEG